MRPIQILMDDELLREIDQVARRRKTDRSKLLRVAARGFLDALRRRELEARHRKGYTSEPTDDGELGLWEAAQAWPES
jgi:metal-responsive CopG/Arc/MetJ family transcriptional regulator